MPSSAPSLSARDIRHCADGLLSFGPIGVVARAALLFGVATFLRQSNYVVGASATVRHLLSREDVTFKEGNMEVLVRSTKTIWDARDAVVIPVAAAPYCPVAAYGAALRTSPHRRGGPLFICPEIDRPLTAAALTSMIRGVLRTLHHPDWARFTIHSLRHTGARLASAQGATLPEIMDHGTWTSRSVHTYLPRTVHSSVSTRVTRSLAMGPKE